MRHNYPRSILIGCLLPVVFLTLAACSFKLPGAGEPPKIYQLEPDFTFSQSLKPVDWTILVDQPVASSGIASGRIALRRKSNAIEYYRGAVWSDPVPKMIQGLLVEAFEASGKTAGAGRATAGLGGTYLLKGDVRDFQANYLDKTGNLLPDGSAPAVDFRFSARLIKQPEREIVASKTFVVRVRADGTSMIDIVRAFEKATGEMSSQVVNWSISLGQ